MNDTVNNFKKQAVYVSFHLRQKLQHKIVFSYWTHLVFGNWWKILILCFYFSCKLTWSSKDALNDCDKTCQLYLYSIYSIRDYDVKITTTCNIIWIVIKVAQLKINWCKSSWYVYCKLFAIPTYVCLYSLLPCVLILYHFSVRWI